MESGLKKIRCFRKLNEKIFQNNFCDCSTMPHENYGVPFGGSLLVAREYDLDFDDVNFDRTDFWPNSINGRLE